MRFPVGETRDRRAQLASFALSRGAPDGARGALRSVRDPRRRSRFPLERLLRRRDGGPSEAKLPCLLLSGGSGRVSRHQDADELPRGGFRRRRAATRKPRSGAPLAFELRPGHDQGSAAANRALCGDLRRPRLGLRGRGLSSPALDLPRLGERGISCPPSPAQGRINKGV